jgi:hypothetical protein
MASRFAEVVRRVHHRYAVELVGAFRLCPFMTDPETAFGTFVVVLDRELDVTAAADCVVAAPGKVIHLIYPLVTVTAAVFERFGNQLHQTVAKQCRGGPVHASFHPHMEGDTGSPSRLVGVVRRAPDPFVQFVPEGLHKGGSTFLDIEGLDLKALVATPVDTTNLHAAHLGSADNAKSNYERMDREAFAQIEAILADVHADRDRSYAEYLDALLVD